MAMIHVVHECLEGEFECLKPDVHDGRTAFNEPWVNGVPCEPAFLEHMCPDCVAIRRDHDNNKLNHEIQEILKASPLGREWKILDMRNDSVEGPVGFVLEAKGALYPNQVRRRIKITFTDSSHADDE